LPEKMISSQNDINIAAKDSNAKQSVILCCHFTSSPSAC
jgi:hypothetical protein